MKKISLFTLIAAFSLVSLLFPLQRDADAQSASGFENRCGWVTNPTPANWSLIDKDGEWLIGAQGGYQAPGDENIPEFPDDTTYWKKNNGPHGYGCGCLMVKVDKKEKRVLEIKSGKALPLAKCRADKTLGSERNL
jgi:hypothetical protein